MCHGVPSSGGERRAQTQQNCGDLVRESERNFLRHRPGVWTEICPFRPPGEALESRGAGVLQGAASKRSLASIGTFVEIHKKCTNKKPPQATMTFICV